jgi:uncharacterized protein (DUF1697 family)
MGRSEHARVVTRIALLRAINVGGHSVAMERLRGLFTELGHKNVRTLIASGNVVFDAGSKKAATLESAIEKHLKASLGYEVSTFVRTPDEIDGVIGHEPFPRATIDRAHALWIAFLKEAPGADAVRKLNALRCATDDFHVYGREIYWLRRVTSTDSKIAGSHLERALGAPLTARNITTVTKLAAF